MKKQHFIWILASLLAFAGCDEDKSPYAPTGGEALRIDASVEEIVLDPANNAQTAVTLSLDSCCPFVRLRFNERATTV